MSCWTSPVDHESGRDVDAVLAGISAVPLYLAVEVGDREGLGKFHPAIALDPPDDVVGRGIEVGPPAMTVEFEFLAMRSHRRHDGKWAGRFQKHLEDARPVAPDQRISAPCFHAIFPLPGSVPGESPKRSNASGLLKLPRL